MLGNNILSEQTQFKSHILFEHITQHTHNNQALAHLQNILDIVSDEAMREHKVFYG